MGTLRLPPFRAQATKPIDDQRNDDDESRLEAPHAGRGAYVGVAHDFFLGDGLRDMERHDGGRQQTVGFDNPLRSGGIEADRDREPALSRRDGDESERDTGEPEFHEAVDDVEPSAYQFRASVSTVRRPVGRFAVGSPRT